MNPNGKQPLVEIERLLKQHRATLSAAAETVRLEDVSNYPILVVSNALIELGIPLILRGQLPNDWSVNVSTLEEFHARRLVNETQIDDIRQLFRAHTDDLVVFIVAEDGSGRFASIPA